MDAREVMILITGAHKAFALYKVFTFNVRILVKFEILNLRMLYLLNRYDNFQAIEEGVSHMWTVSAFQHHPSTLFICDEDATLELRVKTVKYFKDLWSVHAKLNHMELSEL